MRKLAALVLAIIIVSMGAPAMAQCPTPMTFDINFVPSAKPPRAQLGEPITYATLEKFRAEIETYREVSIEGYNIRLKRYGEALNRLDRRAQSRFQTGSCSNDEYAAFAEAVVEELRKIGQDYLDVYAEAMRIYRIDYQTYRRTMFDCANNTIKC